MQKLQNASVLLVGLGGVGGSVFEMLVRAGIGHITVVDGDVFEQSNLNRQILCTIENVGAYKTSVARLRAQQIAPDCVVTEKNMRYTSQTAAEILCQDFDYVADCIDSVTDKTDLIVRCTQKRIPIVSAMGSGNRLSPEFMITDIYATKEDGLARVMRKRLRAAGVPSLSVVCDAHPPMTVDGVPGSVSYAPNLSGCVMAQKIITDLICKK